MPRGGIASTAAGAGPASGAYARDTRRSDRPARNAECPAAGQCTTSHRSPTELDCGRARRMAVGWGLMPPGERTPAGRQRNSYGGAMPGLETAPRAVGAATAVALLLHVLMLTDLGPMPGEGVSDPPPAVAHATDGRDHSAPQEPSNDGPGHLMLASCMAVLAAAAIAVLDSARRRYGRADVHRSPGAARTTAPPWLPPEPLRTSQRSRIDAGVLLRV